MRMAERVERLGTETAFTVLAEVKRLEAMGRQVISFAIGEPDFDTPENIKRAGVRAIESNETHYAPSPGISELREAVAAHVAATRGMPVDPGEVVITPGGKPVMFYGVLACVSEGDEVILPNPGFPIYESAVRFAGAHPVPVPLLEEKDFRMDVEALRRSVTPRTRLIIVNSPQNPTGSMLTLRDLEVIAAVARERDLWVLSDEIYSRIVYEGEFISIASLPGMKERTIILDGFSKTYAMTGWRLGYGVMHPTLAEAMTRMVTNCESCTPPFTQYAGIEALRGPQTSVEEMVAAFRQRRDLVVSLLNEIPGISCRTPHGAFYAFPNVTEACRKLGLRDGKAFQEYLLQEGNVAVLARSAFGSKNPGETEEYVRISYAASRSQIEEGMRRIRISVT